MELVELTGPDLMKLGNRVRYRVEMLGEPVELAVSIVLANAGTTTVRCIKQEWEGTLDEAKPGRVPTCPAGHPLVIVSQQELVLTQRGI